MHNLTKDKIDSTPVSLKKLDQVGKHNSYVSDDINVVLEDIPEPSAAPVASAALASAGSESTWQGRLWVFEGGGVWQSTRTHVHVVYMTRICSSRRMCCSER